MKGLVQTDGVDAASTEKSGEQLRNLKAFARDVISAECWGSSSLDGGDIQTLAEGYGLIVTAEATAEDIEAYDLECTEVGGTFYKFSAFLNDDRSDEQPAMEGA